MRPQDLERALANAGDVDAVFNVQRSALLIAALATGTTAAFPAALEDRMHQPYRYPLVPGLEEMVKLRAPGQLSLGTRELLFVGLDDADICRELILRQAQDDWV